MEKYVTILSHPRSGFHLLERLIIKNFPKIRIGPGQLHIQPKEDIQINHPIILVRDGRDCLVSAFTAHKQRDKNDEPWKDMTFKKYLKWKYRPIYNANRNPIYYINPVLFWNQYYQEWEKKIYCERFRYEDMVNNQKEFLERLGRYLNSKPKKKLISNQNIIGIATRERGYKSGCVGNWKDYFDTTDSAYFKKYAGKTMERYGYEC